MTIRVGVFDATGEPVRGLGKGDFIVREGGDEQTIWRFTAENPSLTGGFLLDTSDRMREARTLAGSAVVAFARARGVTDEFFVTEFAEGIDDRLSADAPFSRDPAVLAESLSPAAAGKGAALYDAVDHGLDYAARGRQEHRALIVITAGGDSMSHMTLAELSRRLTTSPTELYVAGVFDPEAARQDAATLRQLAALTGGDAVFVNDPRSLVQAMGRFARDLGAAYSIAYAPPNPDDTAKLRRLNVQLRRAIPGVSLRYRSTYRGDTD
jgi:VWFA-related protein